MLRYFVAGEFYSKTKILNVHAMFTEEKYAVDYCRGKSGYGYMEVKSDLVYSHVDNSDFVLSEDLN